MLWKSHCNICKNYDVGEGSNTQNRIHFPFCNLLKTVSRVTLTMVCAVFDFLFTFNIYKFVQSLMFVDFTKGDILIHIKTAESNNLSGCNSFFSHF